MAVQAVVESRGYSQHGHGGGGRLFELNDPGGYHERYAEYLQERNYIIANKILIPIH
jgi:hypothetical protein